MSDRQSDKDPGVGHLFPHIYGPIELAAVVKVEPMIRKGDVWSLSESDGRSGAFRFEDREKAGIQAGQ